MSQSNADGLFEFVIAKIIGRFYSEKSI